MNDKLTALLCGLGRIGSKYSEDQKTAKYFQYATHAQVLNDHPGIRWVGAIDPCSYAREEVERKWGVPCFADAEDAAFLNPDFIVLATHPGDNRLEILTKFKNVRYILVEKPLGRTLQEARSFLDYCNVRDIHVQVNYWRRADLTFRFLASGELMKQIGNFQAGQCLYGNGLMNNGVHLLDATRMLLGEPKKIVTLTLSKINTDPAFILQFSAGVVSFLPLDFSKYRENSLDFWGESGRLAIFQEGLKVFSWKSTEHRALEDANEIDCLNYTERNGSAGTALYEMYTNICAHNDVGTPLVCSGMNALKTEQLAHNIIEHATFQE